VESFEKIVEQQINLIKRRYLIGEHAPEYSKLRQTLLPRKTRFAFMLLCNINMRSAMYSCSRGPR